MGVGTLSAASAGIELLMHRLTLPYPPSMNRLWRHANGRTYKDPKAQEFQMVAQTTARAHGVREPLTGPIRLMVELHPKQPKKTVTGRQVRCMDLDNAMKAAIDALNAVAWEDDSQIIEIHAARLEPTEHGALVVMWEAA